MSEGVPAWPLIALACLQARHLAVMELGDWLFSLTKRPTEKQEQPAESAAAGTGSDRLAASAPAASTSTAQRAGPTLSQQQQQQEENESHQQEDQQQSRQQSKQQQQPAAQGSLAAGPDATLGPSAGLPNSTAVNDDPAGAPVAASVTGDGN
jgi:Mg-chelatase subunit ChlI